MKKLPGVNFPDGTRLLTIAFSAKRFIRFILKESDGITE